jgi:hypothetical protein
MAEQHRATPQQWAEVKARADERLVHDLGHAAHSTILELLHRVEALEAAQPNHPEKPDSSLEQRVSEHIKAQSVLTADLVERMATEALNDGVNVTTQPNHPAKPDGSLVDRVEDALDMARGDSEAKARAAIREVAAWLGTECKGHLQTGLHWAIKLDQEAMR